MLPSTSSGLLTADTAITARPAMLHSIQLIGDGTNAATLTVYDNASAASGTVIAQILVDAGLVYETFLSMAGVVCNNGIFADVTGTGAAYIIHYNAE